MKTHHAVVILNRLLLGLLANMGGLVPRRACWQEVPEDFAQLRCCHQRVAQKLHARNAQAHGVNMPFQTASVLQPLGLYEGWLREEKIRIFVISCKWLVPMLQSLQWLLRRRGIRFGLRASFAGSLRVAPCTSLWKRKGEGDEGFAP